jgi:DNA repair exonuclease SbcCD nuclease subunit
MRLAVTADLHLRQSKPERLENLEVLIGQLLSREIRLLIIAGDLFDAADSSYAQLDSLAQRFPGMQLLILPGNHDPEVRQDLFASKNIQVFTKPTLKRIDQRLFLLLPYTEGSTVGESIAGLRESQHLRAHPWILISHGDLTAPRRRENGQERGYFPLTREDLVRFKPARVILGHIHVPNSTTEDVVYPGSPYPITADEYGQRRILILDTESAALSAFALTNPPLHVRVDIFLIPDGREEEQIRRQLESILSEQDSSERISVQTVLKGYTASRQMAQRVVETFLSERQIPCTGIDLDSLKVNDQENLATLADTVRQRVAQLELRHEDTKDLRQRILEKALQIVYGV